LFAQGSPIRPAQLLAKASGPSSKWSHLATLLHSRVAEPESDTEQESLGTVYPGDYFHADRAVRNWPEFSRANSVLDLGGTGGELAIALCKENLRLRATVLVSPAEVDVLARKVAKAGMVDSITVVQNDVFSLEVDGLYDIVLAVHCLYAFPKRILAAMEKIASLVRQDGLLVTQHWFEEGQEPQWDNCLRELDQRIHHTRRPLRHPDAFADRVTSAGFCWLKGQNLHGHKNGVQLRLAQRCDECEPELDEDESSIKNVKRSQVAAVSIPAL
jgi:SAM-dependent methyltransferase